MKSVTTPSFRLPMRMPRLPAGIMAIAVLVRGFGVGDIHDVIAVDDDAAGPAELGELAEELAVLGEDLDAVVVAVADIQIALGIHRQAVRHAELAGPGARLSPTA